MRNEKRQLADQSRDALSQTGRLAELITGFKVRHEQQEMAAAISETITAQQDLVVEAGTGIGKTFAYLVPALLSGKRTIVSTATRNLQDQIYSRDLPTVIDALGVNCNPALLKGRTNYLCIERMNRATQQTVMDKDLAAKIDRVEKWSFTTNDGDIASVPQIAENDMVWSWLTSTVENCLRKDCEHYDDCYVVDARLKAADADLLVVNHALLVADMALKEEGFADFLPRAELIIVDEAHHLKDFAERSFTESFSSRLFMDALKEIDELLKEEARSAQIRKQLRLCSEAFNQFVLLFQSLEERAPMKAALSHHSFAKYYQPFLERSDALVGALKAYTALSEQWENCVSRLKEMLRFVDSVCGDSNHTEQSEAAALAWFHRRAKSVQIHLSPLDVSTLLAEKSKQYQANWIYTSATLAVEGDFSYFLSSAVCTDKPCLSFGSPFDYPSQAAFYFPRNMPHPQYPNYTSLLIEKIRPILSLSQGCAFLLFTSYRALNEAAVVLAKSAEYTVLVQGSMSKSELIERFISTERALLLGTSSFWNGVDIKGNALRCVVIDRLPFASPADPLTQARKAFFERQEMDFFSECTLPNAVIALRQGVGRLIRSEYDRGVVVIGDPRLRQKRYGSTFMRSLPAMTRCHDIASLEAYLK